MPNDANNNPRPNMRPGYLADIRSCFGPIGKKAKPRVQNFGRRDIPDLIQKKTRSKDLKSFEKN